MVSRTSVSRITDRMWEYYREYWERDLSEPEVKCRCRNSAEGRLKVLIGTLVLAL
jgi:hypothetical protein